MSNGVKLLFISGDTSLAQGKKGPFYYLLEEFSKYWDRIDIICPKVKRQPVLDRVETRSGKSKVKNIFGNVFIHPSLWPIIFHPWFILKKGSEIYKKEKFDIFGIHSYPPFYNDIGGCWLYNKIKVPYILEIMHITGYPKAGNLKDWFYKILTSLFVRFFGKKAKIVRVINRKQVPEFLKKFGLPEKKLRYIPSFYIDLDIFKPEEIEKPRTRTPQENKLPTGQASSVQGKKYDMVFSGRLVKNKGINLLLRAVEKLKLQSPNIKLIIVGSGPLENKIKKFIKKNKLENNIEFAGWLPTIDDVAKIYNQSKIFVMPSFNEGGPRVTLEAMACKVPVITSKVGIMLDIIKHGENGLFIDWNVEDIANKILLLLKDEDSLKKIAENGYQTVQQFERKKAIKNYAEKYQNLLYSARV